MQHQHSVKELADCCNKSGDMMFQSNGLQHCHHNWHGANATLQLLTLLIAQCAKTCHLFLCIFMFVFFFTSKKCSSCA